MNKQKNKTVLMLDDDMSICKTVEHLIANKGIVFVSTDNLYDACFKLGQLRPDVAIADFEFQHGKNISYIASELRKLANKVIILTARNPEYIRKEFPELDYADIVQKAEAGAVKAVELALQ